MPVQPTYPGVYVEEIPSGVRTITGVATSVAAFIGRARKGVTDTPVNIYSYADYERNFGGLWEKSPMSFAVRDFFLNGGGEAVIVRVKNGGSSAQVTIPTESSPSSGNLILAAATPGSWGDALSVMIDHNTKDKNDITLFNITISETGGATEKFLNVSTDANSTNYLSNILAQNSQLMRVETMSTARPIATENNISSPLTSPPTEPLPYSVTDNGTVGSDGSHITDNQLVSGSNMEADKRGLYALEDTNIFNLLCIPPYTSAAGTPIADDDEKATDVTTDLISAADAYCKKRRALLIVDPHSSWNNRAKAADQFSDSTYPGSTSDHAAIFFPRLLQSNPLKNNQIESFVPCGTVAGIMARTDTKRGVWKAPAGTEASILGVKGFTVPLSDPENGSLNQLGINCLRSFDVYGRLVWGARTLAGADVLASEWKYIPIRRLALYVEETLYRNLKWVVFEPNDEPLWAQIRLNVGAFMHGLFRQGAFQGKKREAYFVKCDAETTTQTDRNNGIVNIVVGFAPLKPAEFVIIKLQQMAGQIEV